MKKNVLTTNQKAALYTKEALYMLIISFALISCGDPIDVTDRYNLEKNAGLVPKVAFEGRISNQVDSNYVKITGPSSIKSSDISYIPNAMVSISDNRGNSEILSYVGNGRYQCYSMVGESDGRVYTMNATVNGVVYTATQVMPFPLLPGEYVTYEEEENRKGRYKMLLFASVRTDQDEYYMFQSFKNDTLENDAGDVLVADNQLLNGKIEGIEMVDGFEKGDRFRYKIFSITKEAYDFYNGINAQLNNDGGVFSTPPANVKGNIPDAQGLFQATYFVSDTITVK